MRWGARGMRAGCTALPFRAASLCVPRDHLHTSAYVSIRQHPSASVSIRLRTLEAVVVENTCVSALALRLDPVEP